MNRWKHFIIDIGDTIGGIFLGMSFYNHDKFSFIFGAFLIITSIYLEHYKRGFIEGKKSNNNNESV